MPEHAVGSVLVVEDDPELAGMYAEWLENRYEVSVAHTVREAFALLDDTIDVALIDRRLPDGRGERVVTAIRNRGIDVRTVVVTALAPDFDLVDLECDEYLTKPVDPGTLSGTMRRMIDRNARDSRVKAYLALVSRRAAIQRRKSPAELAISGGFAELELRIDDLREHIEEPPAVPGDPQEGLIGE